MENLKDWIPILAGLAAVIGLFYKREEVLALRHKDFSTRLDATIRFFDEFYGKEQGKNKLVLDRAAQDVVKSELIDFKFLCYLIKLDENFLIKLDELIHHYKVGKEFIIYLPSLGQVDVNNFSLKLKNDRSVKKQNLFFNLQYFLFAFIVSIPFLISPWFSSFLMSKETPLIFVLCTVILGFASFMAAAVALLQASSLSHAEKFMQKITEADQIIN
ncbi:hypothetical protein F3J02_13205 [Acinetobacter sp. Tr-809]|uniref:hypothetical protein n=1 Tax=Acinetobacter sp. Tr-809 TaxID=2608324 RepID=UPI001422AD89|nr:hypothetical protein [Acinetobacter sp. Tr-809]NIE97424.1 hypothetical protein [Acinetobacter sp. Tr-809]